MAILNGYVYLPEGISMAIFALKGGNINTLSKVSKGKPGAVFFSHRRLASRKIATESGLSRQGPLGRIIPAHDQ